VGEHVGERDALVVARRIRDDEIAAKVVLGAVAGEVQQRDLRGVGEQIVEGLAQPSARHRLAIGGEQLRIEVHPPIVVPAQQALSTAPRRALRGSPTRHCVARTYTVRPEAPPDRAVSR
jgi:hypothetical protein